MPRTIQQVIGFSVSADRLYRTYLSSRKHAAACGWGRATITPRVGGRMKLAPHISGRFLLLVPGRMIVQTWRGANWRKSEPDSILILAPQPSGGKCRLVMVHANVPDARARSIARGWRQYYWRPWKKRLEAAGS